MPKVAAPHRGLRTKVKNTDQRKRRQCLRCDRWFVSDGPQCRLCKGCTEFNRTASSEILPYRLVLPGQQLGGRRDA